MGDARKGRRWTLPVAMAVLLASPSRAEAFSGIFVAENDVTTQVTSHRLAISLLRSETVLWDQVEWTGGPATLAWVTPIQRGANATLTGDAWFASLDGSTQPIVFEPPQFGPAKGCAIAGCANHEPAFSGGPDRITVRVSPVAGPVETLTIPGSNAGALRLWLLTNGFAFPEEAAAAIDATARDGFDFLVMRLRPNCGENRTRPIRVVTPGAKAVIPTRMMSVGAGRALPIRLFVLSDRRSSVAGASVATLDLSSLTWDDREKKSNYDELRDGALRDGRAWLTEYAEVAERSTLPRTRITPSIFELYPGVCGKAQPPDKTDIVRSNDVHSGPCTSPATEVDSGEDGSEAGLDAAASDDAGDAGDAGIKDASPLDASIDAGAVSDGGASASDAGFSPPERDTCADNLAVGVKGFDLNGVFLTRLTGTIATTAGAPDISLIPTSSNEPVSNGLQAVAFEDEKGDRPNRSSACESVQRQARSSPVAPLLAGLFLLLALARRSRSSSG